MPDSNTNTQLKRKVQKPSELTPIPALLLRYRKLLIILAHIVVFAASPFLSFLLIHNMQIRRSWLQIYPPLLLFVLIIKLPVFALFKQYRGWWRYVGISDLTGIMRASLVSTFIIVALWFVMGYIEPIYRQAWRDLSKAYVWPICLPRFCFWPGFER
jgi:FlaA1/EpsC-like NDP-sugar epimerase